MDGLANLFVATSYHEHICNKKLLQLIILLETCSAHYLNKTIAYWLTFGHHQFVRLPDQNNLHFVLHEKSLHDLSHGTKKIDLIGLKVGLKYSYYE